MPITSFQGMQLLSTEDLDRILTVTDALNLHRDWIVIPIDAAPVGREIQQPDGKIIIHAPSRPGFEAWMKGLRGRLLELELGRVPRREENDPKFSLTGPGEIRPTGTRGYLGAGGILR
jgi:hypothetical protein